MAKMIDVAPIELTLDSQEVVTRLGLFLAEISQRSGEVSQAFIDRFEALIESGGIDLNRVAATGANALAFRLELTDSFLKFMAATRAGDFDVVV